jgi:hypothetical protein
MTALLLAFACEDPASSGSARKARAGARDTGTGGEADSAQDTGLETGESGGGESGGGSGTVACYLGPDRDYGVCLPVTGYDAAAFGADYDFPDASEAGDTYVPPARYLDITAFDEALEVAPNFVLGEYLYAWKGQWGVMQSQLIDHLQELRDSVGAAVTVTSGYRSPAYNASVGGAEWSRHMYGDAADIDVEGWSVEELGVLCEDLGADYVGLYEDGHTHCDWRYDPLDPAFYDAAAERPSPVRVAATLTPSAQDAWSAPATGFDEGEPFRRWEALDREGHVLATATGRRFTPPEGTACVRVAVGGQVTLKACR